MPRDALSEPGRPRRDPQGCRTSRCSSSRASTSAISPTTRPEEALRRRQGAQGPQHGDQQEGDHRRGLSLDRHRGEEPDPALDVVLQRRRQGRPVRSGRREEAPRRGRLPERVRDRPLGDAGAAPLQPERPAHRRADAGRPRQGRRQGRDQELRMGRVPQAPAGGRAPDGHARLDRRQRRSGQLPAHPARLRRRQARRRQHREVVRQAVRRPRHARRRSRATRRSAPSSTKRRRSSSRSRRPGSRSPMRCS